MRLTDRRIWQVHLAHKELHPARELPSLIEAGSELDHSRSACRKGPVRSDKSR